MSQKNPYTIKVSLINLTTGGMTLNSWTDDMDTPMSSGNFPVVSNGEKSAVTNNGNGYYIPLGQSAELFQASGGQYTIPKTGPNYTYDDNVDYPNTTGKVNYNLTDGLLTITWDIGSKEKFSAQTSSESQWNAEWTGGDGNYTVTVKLGS